MKIWYQIVDSQTEEIVYQTTDKENAMKEYEGYQRFIVGTFYLREDV
jgi:hypothetical protein